MIKQLYKTFDWLFCLDQPLCANHLSVSVECAQENALVEDSAADRGARFGW